ncbi:MAG TPA: 50S ribosomal protein L32 [Candidatus Eisenbacteria bacterium]|jgi:large subunit ribosomal protein L32|nr:50S ribosomal protein L32 [Candidatus Eisenbacteria bacterium]
MPNPKRRHSNTRTRKRRTHDLMTAAQNQDCPTCASREVHTPLRRHRVCPVCGHYKGRAVLQIKVKEKKPKA